MAKIDEVNAALAANRAETAKLSTKVDTVIQALKDLRDSGGATMEELDAVLTGLNQDTADTVDTETKLDDAATGAANQQTG